MSERRTGSKCSGGNFDDSTIDAVWNANSTWVSGSGPDERRRDVCGADMIRKHHGRTDIATGWEVDHIKPCARGGSDDLGNLQPLQYQNNRTKGDDWPRWSCAVPQRVQK